MPADLVLHNACVLSMERGAHSATLVAVRGGRIALVGSEADLESACGPGTRVIDCEGKPLLPGFVDAHLHLLALASRLSEVDCSRAHSTDELVALLKKRARSVKPGEWVRATGYDEHLLEEQRHPTARDLDRASAVHPIRLDHGSGHACVLNTLAMRKLGVTREFTGTEWGVVERDESGAPTGLLLEMNGWVSDAMRDEPDGDNFDEHVREASQLLLSRGVTAVMDASPSNGVERWRALSRLKELGCLGPRAGMMVGIERLEEAREGGLRFGEGEDGLWVGPAKVMLALTAGAPRYDVDELRAVVLRAQSMGFPVAIHAVEEAAVSLAADALFDAQRESESGGFPHRHRIEHCAECPPLLAERVVEAGAMVVTNPGFIYHRGARYLAAVPSHLLPHLYPAASLLKLGMPVAAGSDAPVTPPDPLLGICAAATRKTESGELVAPAEAVDLPSALLMHTLYAARACYRARDLGSITPGKFADLVLLARDPATVYIRTPAGAKAALTVLGGRVVWEG